MACSTTRLKRTGVEPARATGRSRPREIRRGYGISHTILNPTCVASESHQRLRGICGSLACHSRVRFWRLVAVTSPASSRNDPPATRGVPSRPSIHSAQGLDFLSLLLREAQAPANEVMACDRQRLDHLGALSAAAADPVERAHFMLRVAAAHADGGTAADLALARKKLDEILKLGAIVGESAVAAARAALKTLPR